VPSYVAVLVEHVVGSRCFRNRVCRCLDETAKQNEPIDNAQPEANRLVSTILKRTCKEMRIAV
jgi:hypothetical protein